MDDQLYMGRLVQNSLDDGLHDINKNGIRRRQAQRAGELGGAFVVTGYFFSVLQNGLDKGHDVPACLSQFHFAPHALEQGKAKFFFQLLDLSCHGGWRIIEMDGGFLKAAGFHNGHKGGKIFRFHSSSLIDSKKPNLTFKMIRFL